MGYGLLLAPMFAHRGPPICSGAARWPLRVVEWNGYQLSDTNGYSFAAPSWPACDSSSTHFGSASYSHW